MDAMRNPFLFEVNARHWMTGMREVFGRGIDLGSVPESEFERWVKYGVTHVWLMGVWPTGEVSRGEALRHDSLRKAYDEALPGWSEGDVMGSPYAVADLCVDEFLGGDTGLRRFRERLKGFGLGLVLDFVPNHLGRDHEWVRFHPERFVGADQPFEGSFKVATEKGERFLAHGKDPFFPGWTDTVQVEYRNWGARRAMATILGAIADRCDGVRCDMAMLVLENVFERTWEHVPYAGDAARGEFWAEAISSVRERHPDFLFLAEAYWGLEERLCDVGFDFAYDKTLYDRLVHDDGEGVVSHVLGMGGMNARRAHFLENHDEPRLASAFGKERIMSALVTTLCLPGMRFLHDGQVDGFRRFARIQLGRRGGERQDPEIFQEHESVLRAVRESAVGGSAWRILTPKPAWQGNGSHRAFLIVLWEDGPRRDLVVINLAPHQAQCRVELELDGTEWTIRDRLGEEIWLRSACEMRAEGLYLDVGARKAQIFALSEITACLEPSA